MDTSLVIASLGSERPGAGDALREHAALIRGRRRFARVEVAFLDGHGQSLRTALDRVAPTAPTIVVVPYFLGTSRLVTHTIPAEVAQARFRFPRRKFLVTPPLLAYGSITRIVTRLAATTTPAANWLHTAVVLVARDADEQLAGALTRLDELARSVADKTGVQTVVGFLERARPTMADAIGGCVGTGATSVIVVPLFLHAGRQVTLDIPAAIGAVRRRFPAIEIVTTAFLGSDDELADLIQQAALQASAASTA